MAWTVIYGHLKELGIKYDPSHARYAGGDYLKETQDWGDRFRHIHLKGSMLVGGSRVDAPRQDWMIPTGRYSCRCFVPRDMTGI